MYKKPFLKITMLSLITSCIIYANETKQLDSVIVTANKVEENIKNVPQSITVIDEYTLEEKGITDIRGIIQQIPNMIDIPSNGTMVNFRGLNTSMFTNNNPVVIYIDGVPTTDRASFDVSLSNVERVEVLRGPQGTLYGKDAIGGVINIVTKTPEDVHQGTIGLEYSKFNTLKSLLNINGPISENLYYGLNAQTNTTDGWVKNNYNNDDKANKTNDYNYNAFLLYNFNDKLSAKLSLSQQDYEQNWDKSANLAGNAPLSQFNRNSAENTAFDVPTKTQKDVNSQSLNISYMINDELEFTSVTTRKHTDADSYFDGDFGISPAYNGLKQFDYTENEEYTQEFRISSTKEDVKWVAGLYFDDAQREQGPYGYEFPGSFVGDPSNNYYQDAYSKANTETQAIFAQGTFPIAEKLDLTLGGRYQKIRKDIDLDVHFAPIGTPLANPYISINDKKTWNEFIPKIGLTYKLSDAITPFVSISKGYMPGGYNYFASSNNISENIFEPQISTNYEIGIKGSINDFSYTASIFRMDIKDIHVFKVIGQSWITSNAKKAHSQGIEFDFRYVPDNNWEIFGAFGIIDAEYDDYDAQLVKYDGENIENTPKYTMNLSVAYNHPEGFYGRVDTRAMGKTSFHNAGNFKFEEQKAYALANVKLGYRFSDFDVYAFVNNITDEEYITSYRNNGSFGIASYNDPRTYGVGLRYKF